MGERKEDSVLLALSELKKIQEDRRQEEEDEERKKQEDLRLAREAEVKKALDEEERKKREAEEKIRREAEDTARMQREERIRIASEGERARAEAEVQAQHEQKMHELTLEAKHKKVPWVPIGIVGAIVVAGAAWMVMQSQWEADEQKAIAERQEEEIKAAKQENERLQREFEQSERNSKELEAKLAAASTDEERARILREMDKESDTQRRIKSRGSSKPTAPAVKKGIKIDDGDDPLGGLGR